MSDAEIEAFFKTCKSAKRRVKGITDELAIRICCEITMIKYHRWTEQMKLICREEYLSPETKAYIELIKCVEEIRKNRVSVGEAVAECMLLLTEKYGYETARKAYVMFAGGGTVEKW